ncbi:BC85_0335 family putative methyltransferase [Mycoplasmopsis felifaucium]|uniref:Methyltransferase n=1 Tax=Mycoplasmopsis felifaucium TaxID=35768 RepID=A0ABZ2RQS0_9BACT
MGVRSMLMNKTVLYSQTFMGIDLSNKLNLGLFISAIVVSLLGTITFISIWIKTLLIKKNIDKKRMLETEKAIEEQIGQKLGNLPAYIDEAFPNKLNQADLMQLINTVYLNKAQSVLLVGLDLENTFLSLKTMTLAKVYVEKNGINSKKWNDAVIKFPNEISEPPLFANINVSQDYRYDLIYVINSDQSNFEIYKKYYKMLNSNGMMIVIQNPLIKKDLKLVAKEFKTQNIRYEISKNKDLFLYVVKSNDFQHTNI